MYRYLGKPPNEITKGDRDYSKKIVYGILYGMGN
jgi:DNA polymerase I-like protein with 3'-5' exonuclease and polymerase domains